MHIEMMMIMKIIKSGNLRHAIEFGITPEDFTTSESQAMYRRLLTVYQHSESSGTVLGPTLAEQEFKNLPWSQVDEHVTLDYLCHAVRKGRLLSTAGAFIASLVKHHENQDMDAIINQARLFTDNVSRVGTSRNHDVDGARGLASVVEKYDRRKSGEDKGAAMWPWRQLTNQVGPVLRDDYIIYYGRPKQMKSWLLFNQAADMILQDIPITIYTKEMTTDSVYQRLAGIIAMVPYMGLRMSQFTPEVEARFKETMADMIRRFHQQKDGLWVLSGKDMGGKDTISWFRSKAERYKSKMLFIDGMYLMSPENGKLVKTNERLENVSRAARNMVLELETPLACTLQANRQAAKHDKGELDEIAMSDAFSQDCTVAMRVIRDKARQPDGRQTVSLIVAGAREWDIEGIRVYAEPCTDFGFHSILSDKEIAKAKDQESADQEKKVATGNKLDPRTSTRKQEAEAAAAAIVARQ